MIKMEEYDTSNFTIEQLKSQIETWRGVNRIITNACSKELAMRKREVVTTKKPKKVYTEKDLFSWNKKKQVDWIRKNVSEKIPKFEKDRVKLILKYINVK